MKIKAIKLYRDKHEDRLIKLGEVYDTTKERAELIVSKGFAVFEEQEIKEEPTTPSLKKRRK